MILKLAGSLIITLIIEVPVAFLFHARGKDLLLAVLVNILTNPALVLLSGLFGNRFFIQMILETVAWGVEGCYYKKYSRAMKHVFICSLCCNAASYCAGLLL